MTMFRDVEMPFLESLNDMEQEGIVEDVSEGVFDQWIENNMADGVKFAEREIIRYTCGEVYRNRYNSYYGLKEGDEDYLDIYFPANLEA